MPRARLLLWTVTASLMVGAAGLGAWQLVQDGKAQAAREADRQHHLPPGEGQLSLTWLGVTAVLIRDASHAILIDPFFSRPEGLLRMIGNQRIAPDLDAIRAGLAAAGVNRLEAVLVSQSHFDHAMDAGEVAALTGARLIGSSSTLQIGRGAGLPESRLHEARSGEVLQMGSFRVRFVESRHAGATGGRPTGDITAPLIPPARYLDYRLGGTWSILVEHRQGRVLHHGSAGYLPGALAPYDADIALLGIALIDDLPAYLSAVVDAVGARQVIPTHWDDFTRPLSEPLRPFPFGVDLPGFLDRLARERPDLTVGTLPVGIPIPIGAPPEH